MTGGSQPTVFTHPAKQLFCSSTGGQIIVGRLIRRPCQMPSRGTSLEVWLKKSQTNSGPTSFVPTQKKSQSCLLLSRPPSSATSKQQPAKQTQLQSKGQRKSVTHQKNNIWESNIQNLAAAAVANTCTPARIMTRGTKCHHPHRRPCVVPRRTLRRHPTTTTIRTLLRPSQHWPMSTRMTRSKFYCWARVRAEKPQFSR